MIDFNEIEVLYLIYLKLSKKAEFELIKLQLSSWSKDSQLIKNQQPFF